MGKNYYIILGLSPEADQQQIKAAYRQRAKEYHPDRQSGDARRFIEIQEAYSVLRDPTARRAYDQRLHQTRVYRVSRPGAPEPLTSRQARVEPLRPHTEPADLGEVSLLRSFDSFQPSFDEIFDRLWSNFSSLLRPKAERLESLNVEVVLTPAQARRGGHVRLRLPARAVCPTCGGRGGLDYYECWQCAGEGAVSGEYPVLVSFPTGIAHGYRTRIALDFLGIHNLYLMVHFRVRSPAPS